MLITAALTQMTPQHLSNGTQPSHKRQHYLMSQRYHQMLLIQVTNYCTSSSLFQKSESGSTMIMECRGLRLPGRAMIFIHHTHPSDICLESRPIKQTTWWLKSMKCSLGLNSTTTNKKVFCSNTFPKTVGQAHIKYQLQSSLCQEHKLIWTVRSLGSKYRLLNLLAPILISHIMSVFAARWKSSLIPIVVSYSVLHHLMDLCLI